MRQHREELFQRLMVLEGVKLTDHPKDPGGKTKFGISQLAYPHEDISALTLKRAKELIFRDWLEPLALDHIVNKDLCFQLLESAFHFDPPRRPRRATRIAQLALLILGVAIEIDGVMGVKTIGELNKFPYPQALVNWMNVIQGIELLIGAANEDEMIEMVKKRLEVLRVFARGWLRRLECSK